MKTIFFIWILLAGSGSAYLISYSNKAGKAGDTPKIFPNNSSIKISSKKPTLLMFLHPKCPCSFASVNEFERIISKYNTKSKNYLVFSKPLNGLNFKNSKLWTLSNKLKNVELISDLDSKTAKLFDTYTSGHTLLYTKNRELIFSGGITKSRGHEGISKGREIIESYLATENTFKDSTPIFGCELIRES